MVINSAAIRWHGDFLELLDQRLLPTEIVWLPVRNSQDAATAIRDMVVRGAPAIGITAAYGLALEAARMEQRASMSALTGAIETLAASRPTAVNLFWALDRLHAAVGGLPAESRAAAAFAGAGAIAEEDVETNRRIGQHGLELIETIAASKKPGEAVNILTHCNAGWLATVDWGTATSPIYQAFDTGIVLHVWVDETRPRNQGASLTAWELGHHGVAHSLIVDNAGGHLMQSGEVDLCLVG